MLEISYSLVAVALIALIVYSIFLVRKISNVVDETEKTIKVLTTDVNVTLYQTNELLAKVNVLTDDNNGKMETIEPLFTAVADLSLSVSDLNNSARNLSKKAATAGKNSVKAGAGLTAWRLLSKFFNR